jgi:hypothetical protein
MPVKTDNAGRGERLTPDKSPITAARRYFAMGKNRKSGMNVGLVVFLMLLIGVTAAFAFNLPGVGKYEKVKPANGMVFVPLSKVSDGSAHFFRLEESGKEFHFFIVKGSDGAIHTAFDACDVCFKEKKGYVQAGDKMQCKNCNQKFAITRIGAASGGGCNPSHLPAKVDGRGVSIAVSDLVAGARFF